MFREISTANDKYISSDCENLSSAIPMQLSLKRKTSNLKVLSELIDCQDKYPLRYCENFSSAIQMQLSLKRKTFSDPFVPFLESTSNFKHFQKKADCHSYFISEITDCERLR